MYAIVKKGTDYSLREVYKDMFFTENETGYMWTDCPIWFFGDTKDEVIRGIEMALKDARHLPVLDVTDAEHPKWVEVE
jgi:hypothetical protein